MIVDWSSIPDHSKYPFKLHLKRLGHIQFFLVWLLSLLISFWMKSLIRHRSKRRGFSCIGWSDWVVPSRAIKKIDSSWPCLWRSSPIAPVWTSRYSLCRVYLPFRIDSILFLPNPLLEGHEMKKEVVDQSVPLLRLSADTGLELRRTWAMRSCSSESMLSFSLLSTLTLKGRWWSAGIPGWIHLSITIQMVQSLIYGSRKWVAWLAIYILHLLAPHGAMAEFFPIPLVGEELGSSVLYVGALGVCDCQNSSISTSEWNHDWDSELHFRNRLPSLKSLVR